MADHTHTDHTYIRETEIPHRGGGATLAFIVGGLLALVAVIAFVVWGGDYDRTTVPASDGADLSISVESGVAADNGAASVPAAEETAPVTTAPAAEAPVSSN